MRSALVVGILILAGLTSTVARGEEVCIIHGTRTESPSGLAIGDRFPETTLVRKSGKTVSLSDMESIMVVAFWAPWRTSSWNDLRALEGIAARYANRGVSVIAADIADPADTKLAPGHELARAQHDGRNLLLAYATVDSGMFDVVETSCANTGRLRIRWSTPQTYVISADGLILAIVDEASDLTDVVTRALDKALAP